MSNSTFYKNTAKYFIGGCGGGLLILNTPTNWFINIKFESNYALEKGKAGALYMDKPKTVSNDSIKFINC